MHYQYVGVCNDLQSRNLVNKTTIHILKNKYILLQLEKNMLPMLTM